MKNLWKTTIVIWTDYDPRDFELDYLVRDAEVGDAYFSLQKQELIEDVDSDLDWDNSGATFFDEDIIYDDEIDGYV